jgi:hypothetical protein
MSLGEKEYFKGIFINSPGKLPSLSGLQWTCILEGLFPDVCLTNSHTAW